MNKKFSVIKINGFKGILLALFIVGCLIAGFLIFPGWVCMNIWNFAAGFFSGMPVMTMLHGSMLWCIIALSVYALDKNSLAISFGTAVQPAPNEERIKEIIRHFNEQNAQILPVDKKDDNIEENNTSQNDNDDKIIR